MKYKTIVVSGCSECPFMDYGSFSGNSCSLGKNLREVCIEDDQSRPSYCLLFDTDVVVRAPWEVRRAKETKEPNA